MLLDSPRSEISYQELLSQKDHFYQWSFRTSKLQDMGYDDVDAKLRTYKGKDYAKLDDVGKAQMIQEVYDIYKAKNIFPIMYYNHEGILNEIAKCLNYDAQFKGDTVSCGAGIGTGICSYLFPNLYLAVSQKDITKDKIGAENMILKFQSEKFLKRAIQFCLSYDAGDPNPVNVLGGLRLVGSMPSNFRPMNAKAIYDRFAPEDGVVYDFCCVDGETEYFNGAKWVPLKDYTPGDQVLQYNENGTVSLVEPEEYIDVPAPPGDMLHYQSSHCDMIVSRDHDVVCYPYSNKRDRVGSLVKIKAGELKDNPLDYVSYFIPQSLPLDNYYCISQELSRDEKALTFLFTLSQVLGCPDYRDRLGLEGDYLVLKESIEDLNINKKVLRLGALNKVFAWFDREIEKDGQVYSVYRLPYEEYIKLNNYLTALPVAWYSEPMTVRVGRAGAIYAAFGVLQSIGVKVNLTPAFRDFVQMLSFLSGHIVEIRNNCLYPVGIGESYYFDDDLSEGSWEVVNNISRKYCFVVPSHMLVLRRRGKIFITGNCGFGGRMLGALTSAKNLTYVGTDPNTETMYHLHELGRYIEEVTGRKDSYELHCCGSEEITSGENIIDFAFSSPPYFDLELYCDEETQSTAKYPELESWLEGFVRQTIRNIVRLLKKGSLYAVNIADFWTRTGEPVHYVDDWIRISEEEGAPLYSRVYLGVTARAGTKEQDGGAMKKENILIFRKPRF